MDTNAPESTPQDGVKEFRLSAQQRCLLDEALALLIDTRSRALDVAVQVCRRRGSAVPDVHDFQLPAIIELQRRLEGTRERLDDMLPRKLSVLAANGTCDLQ
ncbi:hypothetical protein B0G75_10371 [Paraburkholderia sp. BL18I3N2]|uniref:hypothetical protein n=1 Tax=Paraburkholderia sp. BL18I3N2 TaxID=1938799 RepID=UPI000D480AED|nr:hypothetical protein [Paraburkholderia sp. BL18I3N2]PRX32845.1 hypothetical protein B0G75_10371 [Paraburkholderia sp. BL18I3N2]